MIIFDLDGTLADCEHRRRHIVGGKNPDYEWSKFNYNTGELADWVHKETKKKFVPRWDKFFEECDKDEPIYPVINILRELLHAGKNIQIWSGRSEVVRKKTLEWLEINIDPTKDWDECLKMRPEGNSEPDELLKEKWIDDYLANMWPTLLLPSEETEGKVFYRKDAIEFVFDDRPKVVHMWRRRGIFVFNCLQSGEVF